MQMVKVSVRQMVEFMLRSGDIDAVYRGANRALEGTRIHQKLQKQKKEEAKVHNAQYKKEAFLETDFEHKGIIFHVEGRADGIWIDEDGTVTIEEIKSTLQSVSQLTTNTEHWHWAQAKCYGYMYLTSRQANESILIGGGESPSDEPIDTLTIALTYCQVETEETTSFRVPFSFSELTAFFTDLLDKYWAFANMEIDRLAQRDESVRALAFPFGAYRTGQRELAVSVFAAIKQKRKLFAQAPTGIGKTISTLFPAVKSLAEGYGAKIFYLTAKTIARQVAEEAFRHMAGAGLRMRVITITARDKICFCETRICDPEYCRYANGHFNRVNGAILDCVSHEHLITRIVAEAYAQKHQVCPAEFQLDLAIFCDTVICDYNHVYDPKSKLQRFFQLGGDFILLNDEAHNLIDRAREMFSAGLYKNDFSSLRKQLGKTHPLYKSMGVIAREIHKACKNVPSKDEEAGTQTNNREPFCRENPPPELPPPLLVFAQQCDEWIQNNPNNPLTEMLLSLYFNTLDYLRVTEIYDERYAFYCDPANGYIRLYCLDPSFLLAQEQKKSRACVFFSATLTPLPYFRSLLGGVPEDFTLRLASPFPRENLCMMVDERISTRYRDRSDTREAVADRLHEMISGQTGNYMAFFPSYAYLTEVYNVFVEKFPESKVLLQSQDMDDGQRDRFLAAFVENPRESTLAFVVLGGVFSEGIDLKGNRLIGAAVVGVGLPLISAERNVLVDYFNRYSDTGFDFAYIYPGMNKVLQAAGRVIRTENDRGVVLLIDRRYGQNAYRSLFPYEWNGYTRLKSGAHFTETLNNFWHL